MCRFVVGFQFIPPLLLSLASPPTLAQEPFYSVGTRAASLPSSDVIREAQAKAQGIMGRLPESHVIPRQSPSVPRVDAIPKPAAPPVDLAAIAARHKELRPSEALQAQPDLLVLVSLSMPVEALERTIVQAEKAGATLVFRGLKDDSMMSMGREIERRLAGRHVATAIHPPAFQQFSVTHVPAVVMAMPEAGNILDDGCAMPDTFVKVAGDVSIDHALEYIERKSPVWAPIARAYRVKITPGIN